MKVKNLKKEMIENFITLYEEDKKDKNTENVGVSYRKIGEDEIYAVMLIRNKYRWDIEPNFVYVFKNSEIGKNVEVQVSDRDGNVFDLTEKFSDFVTAEKEAKKTDEKQL